MFPEVGELVGDEVDGDEDDEVEVDVGAAAIPSTKHTSLKTEPPFTYNEGPPIIDARLSATIWCRNSNGWLWGCVLLNDYLNMNLCKARKQQKVNLQLKVKLKVSIDRTNSS